MAGLSAILCQPLIAQEKVASQKEKLKRAVQMFWDCSYHNPSLFALVARIDG